MEKYSVLKVRQNPQLNHTSLSASRLPVRRHLRRLKSYAQFVKVTNGEHPMNTTLPLNSRLLTLIGRRFPAAYDAIIPRFGPSPDPWNSRLSHVALNPQPLPPQELGAAIAAEFIHT